MRNVLTEAQEKWLTALESGDYHQADGCLWRELQTDPPTPRGYCCLGVAMELFNKRHLGMKATVSAGEPPEVYSNAGVASDYTVSLLHLSDCEGAVHGDAPKLRDTHSLAGYNDAGATFAEIAAYIRKYPWAVFTNFDLLHWSTEDT